MRSASLNDDLRLRPRDGHPRIALERLAQFAWHWRIELSLVYIVAMVTLVVLFGVGLI